MIKFIQTITDPELKFISELDYGEESEKHLEALKKVIFEQNGVVKEEQYWYPYEVIELGSNSLKKGHEREFAICTLLIALNVKEGTDSATDLEHKLETHTIEYDQLPKELSELVLASYEQAGC